MRAILGLLGLLIALVVASVLAKKQLSALSAAPDGQQKPVFVDQSITLPTAMPGTTPQVQSQLIQQQLKQSVEAAMQQPRLRPDDVP